MFTASGRLIAFFISSAILCAGQQSVSSSGTNPINVAEFKTAVERLISASVSPAFKSIQGGLQFDESGTPNYAVSVLLPGTERCNIENYRELRYSSMPENGAPSGFEPAYACTAQFSDYALALQAEQELAKAIYAATGIGIEPNRSLANHVLVFDDKEHNTEWVLRVDVQCPGGCTHHRKGGRKGHKGHTKPKPETGSQNPDYQPPVYTVRVQLIPPETLNGRKLRSSEPAVSVPLPVSPAPVPQTFPPVTAPTSAPTMPVNQPDPIRQQIEAIEASGAYSQIPTPQTFASSTVPIGMAERVIENGTAYSLTVLLSGPVSQQLILGPGQSRTIILPAGSYKVAASVLAPNVLPFFGIQNYASGNSYPSRFYIQ